MRITALLSLQGRARRNALRASSLLRHDRERRERVERMLDDAPAHLPGERRFWEDWQHPL